MLDEFKNKISSESNNSQLSDRDKQSLMDEMADRLNRMDSMLLSEQAAQQARLAEILAQRKKKKDDLSNKFMAINGGVQEKEKEFNDRLVKLANEEAAKVVELEKEI